MNVSINNNLSIILNDLSNHLIINGNLVSPSGLFYGKLGIALFFFHYSRYTEKSLYNEYALYLVDIVKSQINEDYPLDYERGLAGIGMGLNYLKKYSYYDVGDNYLNEIDKKILIAITNESRIVSLNGFGRYLLTRYDRKPMLKQSLILLLNSLKNNIDLIKEPISDDTLSLLCDLYLLQIEKEKIYQCLSRFINEVILEVEKNPFSQKLFTLIKLSNISSNTLFRKSINKALKRIFSKNFNQFLNINNLQWLLKFKKIIEEDKKNEFSSEIKSIISEVIFDLSFFNEILNNIKLFSLKEGYSCFGLALLSIINKNNNSWIELI